MGLELIFNCVTVQPKNTDGLLAFVKAAATIPQTYGITWLALPLA